MMSKAKAAKKIIEENKRAVCTGRKIPGKKGIFFSYLMKLDYVSSKRREDGAYTLLKVPSSGDGRITIREGLVTGLPDAETKWVLCKNDEGLYIRPANEREKKPTNSGAIYDGNVFISAQDVAAINPSTRIEYDGKIPNVFYDLYIKIIKDSDGNSKELIVSANPFSGAKKKSCKGTGDGYGTRISATFRGERAKYFYDETIRALRFSVEVEPINGRIGLLSDENIEKGYVSSGFNTESIREYFESGCSYGEIITILRKNKKKLLEQIEDEERKIRK